MQPDLDGLPIHHPVQYTREKSVMRSVLLLLGLTPSSPALPAPAHVHGDAGSSTSSPAARM